MVYNGLGVFRCDIDTELDHIVVVQFENVRLDSFGRQTFAIDESSVRGLDVFDVDLFVGRQSDY